MSNSIKQLESRQARTHALQHPTARQHSWTHSCMLTGSIDTISPSLTHTRTKEDRTNCVLQARCCTFLCVCILCPPPTRTHKPAISQSTSASIFPRRPDSFTLYSIQQPGTDKPNRTDRIDWLNASKIKPTKESRGKEEEEKKKKPWYVSTILQGNIDIVLCHFY